MTKNDEPLYDPDRDSVEDLDLANPEVFAAWFNHPNTNAAFEDDARARQLLPAAEQQREISEDIVGYEKARASCIAIRDSVDATDALRAEFQEKVEKMESYIEAAKLRLLELDD